MRWLWAILGVSVLWAGPLDEQLLREFERQTPPSFSDIEMAFIASGAQTIEEVRDYVTRYEALVAELKLPDRLSQRPAKKKLKELDQSLWRYLENPDSDDYSLIDLIERRTYSPLTATFLFLDIVPGSGLTPEEYRESEGRYEPYFMTNRVPTKRELVSALFLMRAVSYGTDQVEPASRALMLSHYLSPFSTFGVNRFDLKLYNQAYTLYQAKAFAAAAKLAAAAATCFPKREEFQPLCVNLGIQICDQAAASGSFESAFALATPLLDHSGPHRVQLAERLQQLHCEYAQALSESGQLEAALAQIESIELPHNAEAVRTLEITTLEQLIRTMMEANQVDEAEPYFVKLEALDPPRAEQLRLSLEVEQLQQVYDSGRLPEVLAQARQSTTTSVGRDRYLNLLAFFVKTRWDLDSWPEALDALNDVPNALASDPAVRDLRQQTYTSWLDSLEDGDVATRKAVFQRLLADRRLDFSDEKTRAFRSQYGHLLHEEIKLLIWDDKFVEADAKSKEALAVLPNHAELLEQRQLLDTIMQRIGNE